jgi:hypothetical protein
MEIDNSFKCVFIFFLLKAVVQLGMGFGGCDCPEIFPRYENTYIRIVGCSQ